MPSLDEVGFTEHIKDVLRNHRCVFCARERFMIGPLVAPARTIDTPDALDPNEQVWQVPVTCEQCGHINYFAVPEQFLQR